MTRRPRRPVEVASPMDGTVVPVGDLPDPVFAGEVVGPGLAILPDEPRPEDGSPRRAVVVAPCDGRVVSAYPHAVVVAVDAERSVLVHLGLGTGRLEGDAFDVAAADGDHVTVGQPLIGWSPERVRDGGRSTLSPVVALRADADDVRLLVDAGERVREGQPVLVWS